MPSFGREAFHIVEPLQGCLPYAFIGRLINWILGHIGQKITLVKDLAQKIASAKYLIFMRNLVVANFSKNQNLHQPRTPCTSKDSYFKNCAVEHDYVGASFGFHNNL